MIILRQTAEVFALIFLLFSISGAQETIYRLDKGMKIRVRMDVEINSESSSKNDTFTVRTTDAIRNGEVLLVPAGTVIEGRVTSASAAAAGGRSGKLSVAFEKLLLEGGESRNLDGSLVNELRAKSSGKFSVFSIIGGTAIGAILGAVTKSGGGALIGAGVGAGAGTGIALSRKGKNVRIRTGDVFEIVLNRDVMLPVKDF